YRAGSWEQRRQARHDRIRGGARWRRAPLPRGWSRFIVPARFASKITICEGAAAMVAKKTAEETAAEHDGTHEPPAGQEAAPAKRTAKKATARKTAAKKTAAKKTVAKKAAAKGTAAGEKTAAKKTAAKKSAARKTSEKA